MDREQRIEQLEARIAELSAEVRALRASNSDASISSGEPPVRSSRRRLLQLAGAAAAGTAAAISTRSDRVAADDGDPVRASQTVSTTAASTTPTVVEFTNTLSPKVTSGGNDVAANMFLVRDVPNASSFNPDGSAVFPAAIAGYSFRTVANGVYGYTQQHGSGVVGFGAVEGSVGVLASGVAANLELRSAGPAPPSRSDPHRLGQVVCDAAGDVWLCTTAGSPGTWRKLGGPSTAGAFHALPPSRVYDSRAPRPFHGAIFSGTSRTITVADQRDLTSGDVTAVDLVPDGATAVAANVTIVSLSGDGFLTFNPGGDTRVGGSTINWSAPGQVLANGVTLRLNDRQLTIVAGGGGGSTEFIVDICGFYL